jgi:hypothetical protein
MITVADTTPENDPDFLQARASVLFELYMSLKEDLRKEAFENEMREKQITYMEYLLKEFKELKNIDDGFYEKVINKINTIAER